MKSPLLKILAAALALAAGSAMAQGYGYGPGHGPGMRGGWGAEEGWGPGMGYARGMGYGPGYRANLTDEQRSKIATLQEQHRSKNWSAMGQLRSEQFKLRDMYASKVDAKAIAEQQKKVDALREQLFKQRNAMHREIDAVLAN